ncbi:hemin uptake protein HemP [Aliiroseovarius crassostreae]|nr:hemin uptake protein HemP [Aliiroseovarius crassostreae]
MTVQLRTLSLDAMTKPHAPQYEALSLTRNGKTAQITLNGMIYTLTITRAGKLILTK